MIDLKNAMALAIEPAQGGASADRAARDAATIETWKAKLPGTPIYKAHVDGALLLFRPAAEDTTKRLTAESAGERAPTQIQQDLIRACLLHPSMDDLAELAQHRPMLMTKLMIQCMAICGFGEDQDFKRADR
jgi:hypothetical protein